MGWFNFSNHKKDYFEEFSLAIMGASFECNNDIKPEIAEDPQHDLLLIDSLFQFEFFFLHLMQRDALTLIGSDGRQELFERIFPLVRQITIDNLFKDTDNKLREYGLNAFTNNYNIAEEIYSHCQNYGDPKTPLSKNSLIGALIHNIAQAIDRKHNPLFMMSHMITIPLVVSAAHKKYELHDRLKKAGKHLEENK